MPVASIFHSPQLVFCFFPSYSFISSPQTSFHLTFLFMFISYSTMSYWFISLRLCLIPNLSTYLSPRPSVFISPFSINLASTSIHVYSLFLFYHLSATTYVLHLHSGPYNALNSPKSAYLYMALVGSHKTTKQTISVALRRKRTIPTKRPPLVAEF
jgi:hypothetical protein